MRDTSFLHGAVDSVTPSHVHRVLPGASYCELVRAVLESGGSVWLAASGHSMLPTIRDGDEVLVRPTADSSDLRGRIALRVVSGGFILHRVLTISGRTLVTGGDGTSRPDGPSDVGAVIGIATAVRRGGRIRALESTSAFGALAALLYFETVARRLVHRALRWRATAPTGIGSP